ncbi:MAG: hypothetical protein ACERKD_23960 [Prolixibacteraceae bacterium]
MEELDFNETFGLDNRKIILLPSLLIESLTSFYLSRLLNIKDLSDSKVLGNKSGCLSFSQKVNILIEMNAIPKDYRNKYLAFMEIRNQFMHNIDATNFEKCYSFLVGKDKFILKAYPQSEELSREKQLENATIEMTKELIDKTLEIRKSKR